MTIRILLGDCRERLRELPPASVHCCATSPPYFGLRSYLPDHHPDKAREIGLEETPAQFIEKLVEVFREVRRVLRDDGTLWVNMGDSYAGSWGAQGRQGANGQMATRSIVSARQIGAHPKRHQNTGSIRSTGIKPKDIYGIPWMLAFALRADGWWLRQDLIWHKPNPLPESVTDRCTKAHEYVFLLSKSERYFYDAEAIREDRTSDEDANGFRGGCYVGGAIDNATMGKRGVVGNKKVRGVPPRHAQYASSDQSGLDAVGRGNGRNKRSVWTVAAEPFSDAHFATFPPALVEPCILAGSPKGGVILDPFFGAGTTGMVADRLGRDCIGIELNESNAPMVERRMAKDAGMFSHVQIDAGRAAE